MSEADLVRRGHKRATRRGAWILKTTGVNLAGCPDDLYCYRGRFLAIEWKKPPNKPTARQLYQLQRIRQADGHAIVATHPDDVDRLLDHIDQELDHPSQEHA